jgi:L-lysine 2,3-aminomutase
MGGGAIRSVAMSSTTETSTSYQAIGLQNLTLIPQWESLDPDIRQATEVGGHVLPFRTNRYVTDQLIDWSRVPDDPIFQLVFPQRAMLDPAAFTEVETLVRDEAPKDQLAAAVGRIRLGLNPHPAGQMTHNVPMLDGQPVAGVQHKYRETVLYFPSSGQTCHAYCTYCFRWAQFVGLDDLKFQAPTATELVRYLTVHPEVTDVLVTGGDPLVMRTRVLRRHVEPLLSPALEHVQNLRFGTKALAYWPQRFVTDDDADDLLRLFEEIVASGRHVAVMAHYSHPVELEPAVTQEAIRRVRDTGAQIRMQGPLIRHVNDSPEAWAGLWQAGVRAGLIPYYMFVERDTGARNYFEVPLVRCYEIFRQAYSRVSGLARSVRGPSMSAFPGKVRVLGVVRLHDLVDQTLLAGLRENLGFDPLGAPDTPRLVCDFIQAREPDWVKRPFFAEFDEQAVWFDQLRPAFGRERFYFETADPGDEPHPLIELTESLLD